MDYFFTIAQMLLTKDLTGNIIRSKPAVWPSSQMFC